MVGEVLMALGCRVSAFVGRYWRSQVADQSIGFRVSSHSS